MLGALALGALCCGMMSNPRRRRRNPMRSSVKRRALARVRRAARQNKRSGGSPQALYRSIMAQTRASRMGLGSRKISQAVVRGIAAAQRNPTSGPIKLPKRLGARLLEWHRGAGSAVYKVGSHAYAGRGVGPGDIEDALWELNRAYEEHLKPVDVKHLGATIRMLERASGIANKNNPRRVKKHAAKRKRRKGQTQRTVTTTTTRVVRVTRKNPRHAKRRSLAPGTAAARLARWRWHHNPLKRGFSHAVIGHNIKLLRKEGRSQRQAIAIALSEARRTGGKRARASLRRKPRRNPWQWDTNFWM